MVTNQTNVNEYIRENSETLCKQKWTLEHLHHHERLKQLQLYSLESRREGYISLGMATDKGGEGLN